MTHKTEGIGKANDATGAIEESAAKDLAQQVLIGFRAQKQQADDAVLRADHSLEKAKVALDAAKSALDQAKSEAKDADKALTAAEKENA